MAERLDGNVLAGTLSEIFRSDMTLARGCCSVCGDVSVLARAAVDVGNHVLLVHCHACDAVLMVIEELGGEYRIEADGLRWLDVPRG